MTIRPLTSSIAAAVEGVQLAAISAPEARELREATGRVLDEDGNLLDHGDYAPSC